jgi:pimeloyl-ACP methyl ester carboxylesterase
MPAMSAPTPFLREAGHAGTPVVLLHSSASSSSQWRALMELLAPQHQVLAPDLQGCGKSAPWHFERPLRLDDEVEALAEVFERSGPRFHLVGHSFGGAVALRAALRYADRLASLTLFEPVLFSLLVAAAPDSEGAREIAAISQLTTQQLDAGELEVATQAFVDYWMGAGRYASTPEAKRPALMAGMPAVKGHWQALFGEPTPLLAWAALPCPCLLMTGEQSRASALGVAAQLRRVLPRLQTTEISGAGHMAPVTHPGPVNTAIASFLAQVDPS